MYIIHSLQDIKGDMTTYSPQENHLHVFPCYFLICMSRDSLDQSDAELYRIIIMRYNHVLKTIAMK